jgi:hypothetical protein
MLRLASLLIGAIGLAAATPNYGYFGVVTATVCTTQNSVPAPPSAGTDPLFVDRIAWQLVGPAVPWPLVANGVHPAGDPDLLCLGGCASPPCWPVSACGAGDLWWSVRYDNLSVAPSSVITLPDTTGGATMPSTMVILYDDVAPSPSPTPSGTPSPRRTPPATPTPSVSPSAGVAAADGPVVGCPPVEPHATPAAIALGILLGGAIAALGVCWRQGRVVECPYCVGAIEKGRLRGHLDECKSHLERFTPVVLERVRIVHTGTGGEEKEDLIARPEPVRTGAN